MDILAALPKTPGMAPEALWAWLKRNGKVHPQELIRYKTTKLADPLTGIREKYAACNCTACGESWHTTIEQAWLCQVVKPWLDHKQKTVNPNHAKTAAA